MNTFFQVRVRQSYVEEDEYADVVAYYDSPRRSNRSPRRHSTRQPRPPSKVSD